MKDLINKCGYLIVLLFVFANSAIAQRTPPPPPGEPPPSVPIDQFMVLALVVTVVFGMYIIVKNKKTKTL